MSAVLICADCDKPTGAKDGYDIDKCVCAFFVNQEPKPLFPATMTDARFKQIAADVHDHEQLRRLSKGYWANTCNELVRETKRLKAIEIHARKLWNALLSTDSVLELWRSGKANKGDRGRCRHLNKQAMAEAREVLGDP
jgi:hypothetical protein